MIDQHRARPHDLLWGLTPAQLPADAPAWVVEALAAGQPVVVRRAQVAAGQIAVGVRGHNRNQRFATRMHQKRVLRCLRPEQLIHCLPVNPLPALRALAALKPYLDSLDRTWGVTGSVGFQLASGIAVIHADSDLDLLLRTPEALLRSEARQLLQRLDEACCRVDVQLETPLGAVALREWARDSGQVLLKSTAGARLLSDPWQIQGQPT